MIQSYELQLPIYLGILSILNSHRMDRVTYPNPDYNRNIYLPVFIAVYITYAEENRFYYAKLLKIFGPIILMNLGSNLRCFSREQ